jgi:DNA primase
VPIPSRHVQKPDGGAGDGGRPSAALADFKTQVMAATDIVDLIGRTVALKKAGKDHKGLCPFHSEKTPSFTVNQSRQFFHCYGCKAGGDAINFVKLRDRVEFMDALKTLAADAGIPVPKFGRGSDDGQPTDEQICRDACSHAAMFFEQSLADPARGQVARDYIRERGLSDETVKKFRLGFAPDGWNHLSASPIGRKFKPEQLHLAGLLKQKDAEKGQGYYDAFRNRLMFPIRDLNGRVIAFGGRILPGGPPPGEGRSAPAKYLNSPETPAFHKGRVVYGLDQARQRIVETKTAVVVEGYADVVMAHQFGATNVVSPLGTALTEHQVGLIRRFADRIVLLFDRDEAGDKAVDKAVGLFLTQPVSIAIADLGEDLDPDEYLLKYGLAAWEKLIAAAPEALTFKWRQLVRQFAADDGNMTGQQKAVESYLDVIGQARSAGPVDPIRWGLTVSQIGKLTGIPTDQLQRRLSAVRPAPKGPGGPVAPVGPVAQATPTSAAGANIFRPVPAAPPPVRRAKPAVLSARDRAERQILGVLLLEPHRWHTVQTLVGPEDFTEPVRARLAEVYWRHQHDEGEPVFSEFLGILDGGQNRTGRTDGGNDSDGEAGHGEAGHGDEGADHGELGLSDSDVTAGELRELAVEVTAEVEAFAARQTDATATLADAIQHLDRNRQAQEKQKLIASLRRSNEQNLDDQQEVDLFQKLVQQKLAEGGKPAGPGKSKG